MRHGTTCANAPNNTHSHTNAHTHAHTQAQVRAPAGRDVTQHQEGREGLSGALHGGGVHGEGEQVHVSTTYLWILGSHLFFLRIKSFMVRLTRYTVGLVVIRRT